METCRARLQTFSKPLVAASFADRLTVIEGVPVRYKQVALDLGRGGNASFRCVFMRKNKVAITVLISPSQHAIFFHIDGQNIIVFSEPVTTPSPYIVPKHLKTFSKEAGKIGKPLSGPVPMESRTEGKEGQL